MLQELEAVGGAEARALVSEVPDQAVMDIVCSWPGAFDVDATLALGFAPDSSFESAVRQSTPSSWPDQQSSRAV